jgi:hypothetical protein
MKEAESQVRAPNLLLEPRSVEEIQRPPNRLAVGRRKIEVVEPIALVGVDDARHHPVDRKFSDTEAATLPGRGDDRGGRRLVVNRVD